MRDANCNQQPATESFFQHKKAHFAYHVYHAYHVIPNLKNSHSPSDELEELCASHRAARNPKETGGMRQMGATVSKELRLQSRDRFGVEGWEDILPSLDLLHKAKSHVLPPVADWFSLVFRESNP